MNGACEVEPESSARYVAFGDESQYGDTLVYAFVVVARAQLTAVECRLDFLKDRFRIPRDVMLHCYQLFHDDKRRKMGLDHLGPYGAQSVVARAVRIMNLSRLHVLSVSANLARSKEAIGDLTAIKHMQGSSVDSVSVNVNPKALLGLMMQTCFLDVGGKNEVTRSNCRILVAEEPSRVRFIGREKFKVHGMHTTYSMGLPSGEDFKIQPEVAAASSHPLFQLADIAAYICSHSLDNSPKNSFFRGLRRKFRHHAHRTCEFNNSA